MQSEPETRMPIKLDVRSVFGSVCRHEYPLRFFDMKHGERLDCVVARISIVRHYTQGLQESASLCGTSYSACHPSPFIQKNIKISTQPAYNSNHALQLCDYVYCATQMV
jgi:hypothetical protein